LISVRFTPISLNVQSHFLHNDFSAIAPQNFKTDVQSSNKIEVLARYLFCLGGERKERERKKKRKLCASMGERGGGRERGIVSLLRKRGRERVEKERTYGGYKFTIMSGFLCSLYLTVPRDSLTLFILKGNNFLFLFIYFPKFYLRLR
jgi:hypothetical protein